MPITFVERNGHPEAMHCPMVVCDVCGVPLVQASNAFAARWLNLEHPTRSSPVYFVHSTAEEPCLTRLETQLHQTYDQMFGGAGLFTSAVGDVLRQLSVNFAQPVGGPEDRSDAADGDGFVQYVVPHVTSADLGRPDERVWSAVVRTSGMVDAGLTERPASYDQLQAAVP